jgi:hypothetical protein
MNKQMRSSTALVNQVLSNQDTLEKLKEDPEGTLRKVEAEVNQQLTLPDRKVTNFIWAIIVLAFSMTLVYSVWVLGNGVTAELKKEVLYATRSDTMLTIVTTVVGFLAGLLAPSPVGKRGS